MQANTMAPGAFEAKTSRTYSLWMKKIRSRMKQPVTTRKTFSSDVFDTTVIRTSRQHISCSEEASISPTLTEQNELATFAAHGVQAVVEANFVGPLDRLTSAVDEMRIARNRHGQTAVEFPDGWRLVPEWVTYQSVSDRENNRIVTQIFIYEAVCASVPTEFGIFREGVVAYIRSIDNLPESILDMTTDAAVANALQMPPGPLQMHSDVHQTPSTQANPDQLSETAQGKQPMPDGNPMHHARKTYGRYDEQWKTAIYLGRQVR